MKKIAILLLLSVSLFAKMHEERPRKHWETVNELNQREKSKKYDFVHNTLDYSWLFELKHFDSFVGIDVDDNNFINKKEIENYENRLELLIENKLKFSGLKKITSNTSTDDQRAKAMNVYVIVKLIRYNNVSPFYYGFIRFEIFEDMYKYQQYSRYQIMAGYRENVLQNTEEAVGILLDNFKQDYFYVHDNFTKNIVLNEFEYKILSEEQKTALQELVKSKKVELIIVK